MIEQGNTFSLLSRPWIPVLRADGTRAVIRPAEITSDINLNPVVSPAWGRPDFDAATREFWIGLLAVACGDRANEDDWDEWFARPPQPMELDAAFSPFSSAFTIDGDRPRFGQVPDEGKMLEETPVPVSDLWMDSQSSYFNKGRANIVLSRAGAAISLFTLQTYAPEGGRGHFTSARGGGPLTTLVIPTQGPTALWHTLWLNVPNPKRRSSAPELARIFPWMQSPAEGEGRYDPDRGDDLQAFWGLPRRIVLDFEPNQQGLPCGLTGEVDAVIVRGFRRRPSGVQYEGKLIHPLSPVRRSKATEPFRAFRTPPGGVGYRHWVGLVVPSDADDSNEFTRPAESTVVALERARSIGIGVRLRASGYETKQNKALGFVESELPVHLLSRNVQSYENAVRRLVAGARQTQNILRYAVRNALFVKRTQAEGGSQKAASDGGALDLAQNHFWDRTEAAFTVAIADLAGAMDTEEAGAQKLANDAAEDWRRLLHGVALAIFDELVPFEDLDAFDPRSARARIEARSDLHFTLLGYGKLGNDLFKALGLAVPEQSVKKAARRKEPAA